MFDRFYNTPATQAFHWPGRLLTGSGALQTWLDGQGSRKVILVVDQAFAAIDWITARGTAPIIVRREPHLSDLHAALAARTAGPADIVLAIGGGATLDLAKALCTHLRFGTHAIRDRPRAETSPMLVAAPTTAGSGSETSRFFILSDDETHTKVAMRSWAIVPDLTILDPTLLASSSPERLLLGAYDACIHFWETHIARGERSLVTDTLALTWIPRILAKLPQIVAGHRLSADALGELMAASSMAGMAISNVRAGMMHTLGESLAAHVALPHPMTLRIFMRPVLESYSDAISEHTAPLWRMADIIAPASTPWSMETFIAAWEDAFRTLNLDGTIREALRGSAVSAAGVCETASRDTTLAKENPVTIDKAKLREIASAALAAWQ